MITLPAKLPQRGVMLPTKAIRVLTDRKVVFVRIKVTFSPGASDHKKSGGKGWGRYIESPLRNPGELLCF